MSERWWRIRNRIVYRSRWAMFKAILKGREPWSLLGDKRGQWSEWNDTRLARNGDEVAIEHYEPRLIPWGKDGPA